ncbi:MAG: hypothetical protein AAF696_15505, partial [Bacteroidota bacterium]
MPARFKPHIFLACTLASEEEGSLIDPSLECDEILRVLKFWIEKGGCDVLQARPGSKLYLEDILSNKNNRREVVGIHIIGDSDPQGSLLFRSRADKKSYDFEEFSKNLADFPKLQFVFLSGIDDPSFIHQIHAAGIPAVFSIKDGRLSPTIVEAFYLQMLYGRSVKDSVLGLDSILKIEISRHEVDFSYQNGPWNGKDLPVPGKYSFFYRKDKFKNLGWRLRSPLLIPAIEKQEIESYLNKVSSENPIEKLLQKFAEKGEPERELSSWQKQEKAVEVQEQVFEEVSETIDTIVGDENLENKLPKEEIDKVAEAEEIVNEVEKIVDATEVEDLGTAEAEAEEIVSETEEVEAVEAQAEEIGEIVSETEELEAAETYIEEVQAEETEEVVGETEEVEAVEADAVEAQSEETEEVVGKTEEVEADTEEVQAEEVEEIVSETEEVEAVEAQAEEIGEIVSETEELEAAET